MDKRIFTLHSPQIRQNAARAIHEAPEGYEVVLKPRTRSGDQNRLLHSLFGEVAKHAVWHDRKLNATQWKTLFISGHAVETKLGADVIPGLENEYVNIRESSAQMSVARMTSLIEYILSWCALNGVQVEQHEAVAA